VRLGRFSGMSPGEISSEGDSLLEAPRMQVEMPIRKMESRSPLAQLLHALNQPLTGLQCSMEVALAAPRTPEQYVAGLREGLELTGRMRDLVEAIREVAEVEERWKDSEGTDLKMVLREVAGELARVGEGKGVRIALDISQADISEAGFEADISEASWLRINATKRSVTAFVFRLVESVLSLAQRESEVRIEAGIQAEVGAVERSRQIRVRCRWRAPASSSSFSRPELGLLIARAGWERAGAVWERERAGDLETVILHIPQASAS
jgi:hypothetical protein